MQVTPEPHAAFLRELARAGALTAAEAATRLGLDRHALARVVERLAALGYITLAGCEPAGGGPQGSACASCAVSLVPAACPLAGRTAWVLTARGRAFAGRPLRPEFEHGHRKRVPGSARLFRT